MYHTVVIGGGCLGAATAISLQRKLNETGKGEKLSKGNMLKMALKEIVKYTR